jgi:DNA-binding NarL/FixJ family response regulator
VTTWVVSPHLLVAQAVTAALTSAGVSVEVRAWDTVVEDAAALRGEAGTRHVVAIFDDPDGLMAVEQISRLVATGDVRVAVVAPGPAAALWGGLLEGGAVDVVTRTTSVSQLADVVQKLIAGDPLMEPERRSAVRAAWAQALDSRRRLISEMRTLSPQQLRVLELLADGKRAREVAEIMEVTVGTVRSHVKALRAKLGAKTQLEAVAMLRRVYEVGDGADLLPRPRKASADAERPPARR